MRYFPTQALNFACKDTYKYYLNPFDYRTNPYRFFAGNVLSGGAAGATSILFVYPLDFARTRLAVDVGSGKDREFQGITDCIKKTIERESFRSIYRGLSISIVGIFVYRSFYFGLYDSGKVILPKNINFFFLWSFALGVTIASGLASYPLDTVRRRLMMTSGS